MGSNPSKIIRHHSRDMIGSSNAEVRHVSEGIMVGLTRFIVCHEVISVELIYWFAWDPSRE